MPYHILGLPIFQDYYTVHDMEYGRIGFAPHSTSRKQRLEAGSLPTQFLQAYGSTSKAANVWPYLIMGAISASCSLLYYYVIFPGMANGDNLNDGAVFGISAVYFGGLAVFFYYYVEPALI